MWSHYYFLISVYEMKVTTTMLWRLLSCISEDILADWHVHGGEGWHERAFLPPKVAKISAQRPDCQTFQSPFSYWNLTRQLKASPSVSRWPSSYYRHPSLLSLPPSVPSWSQLISFSHSNPSWSCYFHGRLPTLSDPNCFPSPIPVPADPESFLLLVPVPAP